MPSLVAKYIHPTSWWFLAITLAVIAGSASSIWQTTAIAVGSVALILLFREDAPWARSLSFYLAIAAAVILIRVLFRIVFSFSGQNQNVLLELPRFELNFGLGAIEILGNVSAEALLSAVLDGSRLAAIILAIAVANTLANPRKLLKSAPGAIYEIATSVSVAINLAPQLIESFARVRKARLLRGKSANGSTLSRLLIPVLEDTIDRSLLLAASMDARGFGRRSEQSAREVALARILGLVGLSLNLIGIFILLSGFSAALSLSLLAVGLACATFSVRMTSRKNVRTSIVRIRRTLVDYALLLSCLGALAVNFSWVVTN